MGPKKCRAPRHPLYEVTPLVGENKLPRGRWRMGHVKLAIRVLIVAMTFMMNATRVSKYGCGIGCRQR